MGRRRTRRTEITIYSQETRILMGLIVLAAGAAVLIAPFWGEPVFRKITEYLGLSSVVWGFTLVLISLRLITAGRYISSIKPILGTLLAALVSSVFFTFWIPQEELLGKTDFSNEGGIIGLNLHQELQAIFGTFIEFILIMIVAVIAFSLLSGVKLEQITGFFERIATSVLSRLKEIIERRRANKAMQIDIVSNGDSPEITNQNEYIETQLTRDTDVDMAAQQADSQIHPPVDVVKANTEPEFIENGHPKEEREEPTGLIGEPKYTNWQLPPVSILKKPITTAQNEEIHKRNAVVIEKTLRSFGIESRINKITIGPTVVQYALSITVGTKVAKVRNLSNDLALALATSESQIRIEAPIPGTSLIGIEIPNPTPNFVYVRELIEELGKAPEKYKIPLVLGKNVAGQSLIRDLTSLPHLLVAGATGTGKSVGINSILTGVLMTMTPDQLRLILVDPKMVELAPYNGIAHLLTPVITDMELVVNALQWAVEEMLRRYRILKQSGTRNVYEFNRKPGEQKMPYIIIVIDEMADLMLSSGVDVESKIVRLTQMARAVGIHLILATQRPSVDVITGLIKANIPGRIAFSVSTAIDSRVVIDQSGAETLIGKGDMLFRSPETGRPFRLQGAFTDTVDTENLVTFMKSQATGGVEYFEDVTLPKADTTTASGSTGGDFSDDSLFRDALEVVINAQKASASLLQRKLRIGYNRAARLIDELYEAGAIGPQEGSIPRKVLITSADQLIGSDETVEEEIDI